MREMDNNALRLYLISLEENKIDQIDSFVSFINSNIIDEGFLNKEVINYHLEGFFYDAIIENGLDIDGRDYLEKHMSFRTIFNNVILEELNNLKQYTKDISIVLLKGLGLWHTIYRKNTLNRRTNDVDLLVFNDKDAYKLIDILLNAGYIQLNQETKEYVQNDKYYSLPPLELKIPSKLSVKESMLFKKFYPEQIHLSNDNIVFLTIRIEIHTALFINDKGEHINIFPEYLMTTDTLSPFKMLNDRASIAYLSYKLKKDVDFDKTIGVHSGALKTLGDIIRLITKNNSIERESISLAKSWRVENSLEWLLSESERKFVELYNF